MAFYKCRNCYEKYRGKQLFTLHVKHEHTEEVQKMCFVCLKMNSSIGNLFRHCRKEKHFACNRCSGRPRTFYRLLVHYITNHCGMFSNMIVVCLFMKLLYNIILTNEPKRIFR
ncbi:unnamed protein product [Hymenolepis diminuta]|uniref:C2H2-type domain-containing protein n=1 Tax=Hymenolepis diminuta TaxID=6216 RepID=A0A564Z8X5_HYMDI|nr:unnamed protein product [Hymenolepis diminuta]